MWIIEPMPIISVTEKMLLIVVVSILNLFIGAEANCEIPSSPERGTVHLLGDAKVNSFALYSCDDGWNLVGASASKCLSTGQWTSFPPKCVAGKESSAFTSSTVPTPTSVVSALPERKATSDENDVQYTPITPEHTQENTCSWSYNSHNRKLSVEINGSELWNEAKVRKGDEMILRCYDPARLLILPNATSISDTLTLTCEVCRIGEDSDVSSCKEILSEPEVLCPPIPDTEVLAVNFTNSRKINSTAHFRCKDSNSSIVGGLDTRICLPSGEWSGANPDCEEPCSIPFVQNGRIGKWVRQSYGGNQRYQEIPVGQRIEDGDRFFLHCDNGYRPLGSTSNWQVMIACRGGKWFDDPFCELPTCDSKPPEAVNGRVEEMDRKHGGTVSYVCLRNFNQVKTGNVKCNKGEWAGVPPTCKDIRCYAEHVRNQTGVAEISRFTQNMEELKVRCKEGYEPRRYLPRCLNGKWKMNQKSPCKEKDCTVPRILNGLIQEQITGEYYNMWKMRFERRVIYRNVDIDSVPSDNTTLYLVCQDSYSIPGTETSKRRISCLDGRWSPDPVCLRRNLGCPPFEKAVGSRLFIEPLRDGYKIGEFVTFSCAPGYKLSTDLEIVMCLTSGWSEGAFPECIKSDASDEE